MCSQCEFVAQLRRLYIRLRLIFCHHSHLQMICLSDVQTDASTSLHNSKDLSGGLHLFIPGLTEGLTTGRKNPLGTMENCRRLDGIRHCFGSSQHSR